MDAQLRKGLLEFCVLAAVRHKDSYGYQIIKDISDFVTISESTLYPILRRLERDGWLESYSVAYNNRLRKYFHITESGKCYLESFTQDKKEIIKMLDFITKQQAE